MTASGAHGRCPAKTHNELMNTFLKLNLVLPSSSKKLTQPRASTVTSACSNTEESISYEASTTTMKARSNNAHKDAQAPHTWGPSSAQAPDT
jgi:hypothetical protein